MMVQLSIPFVALVLGPPLQPVAGNESALHRAGPAHGWHVAETRNFRIYHRASRADAERLARAAETARAAAGFRWLGQVERDWQPACEVYLHPGALAYEQATGVPADVPGVTTIQREGERVLARRIDLHGDINELAAAVLPHEVTHAALAGKFGPHAIPLWASEAMAILNEPRAIIDAHLFRLPEFHEDGRLLPVGDLLVLGSYPERRQVRPFYAQSIAVVEFLVKERGTAVFARFLSAAQQAGYERALRDHYGWTMAELESRWQAYLKDR